MISLEYKIDPVEISRATLQFMLHRPFLALLFFLMRIACILVVFGCGLKAYANVAAPVDYLTAGFAVVWLLAYRVINRKIIYLFACSRKFVESIQKFVISPQKIVWTTTNQTQAKHIEWRSIRHILQTEQGFIIPLTGLSNAARFVWLPFRAFQSTAEQQDFTKLLEKCKIPIRKLV